MNKEKDSNLLNDFLSCLGVAHTSSYSSERYKSMPFQSLFGLTHLLKEYGVECESVRIENKDEIKELVVPFLAHVDDGVVIVTEVGDEKLGYMTMGVSEEMSLDEFKKRWDGVVVLASPGAEACEPDYKKHWWFEFFNSSKKWVLGLCAMVLLVAGALNCGAFKSVATALTVVFNCLGLYFTFLLVQKSAHIHNSHADRVCGVLQKEGCNHILETSASKFFGLFGWSEVGFAYFSVSLIVLLMKPECIGMLALINGICLPFTVWSIWYQKFRAKAWCTLCVGVQTTLWLLFFSYLAGGCWERIDFNFVEFVVIGCGYLGVMLGVNALMPYIEKEEK